MERITECTENVTTDTETESIVSNENFTLRKRKPGDAATLRIGDKNKTSTLTKKGLKKLQKDLVKKPENIDKKAVVLQPSRDPPPAPPPPPPPPPPPTQPYSSQQIQHTAAPEALHEHPDYGSHHYHSGEYHHHGVEGQSPTSPCDCPAYLHDRESPLVISQVWKF